jgi:hypothetical protein
LDGFYALDRILAHVLARELAAFLDLSLQFGADVALSAAAAAGPVLRLGTPPHLLAVAALGLLLAIAARGLLLAVPAMALLLAIPSAWLLLPAAVALLLLLRPALRLPLFPARLLLPGFAARSGLEAFDDPLLDLAIDQALDRCHQRPVLGADQRDGFAFDPGAACAADSMYVILGDVRHVVVDHVRQRFDIEAARRDVGGHQHA